MIRAKYFDGERWIVRLASGEEACGLTEHDAEIMAARIATRSVVYMVGRSVSRPR